MSTKSPCLDFSRWMLIEMLLVVAIGIFTLLGISIAVSILFALSFVVLFLYYAKLLMESKLEFKHYGLVFLLVVLSSINVFFNCFLNDGAMSFGYYKKLIMFSAFVLFVQLIVANKGNASPKLLKVVKTLPIILAVGTILSFFVLGNRGTMENGITLGFSNPNMAALWIMHLLLYTVLFCIEGIKHNRLKLFALPLIPALFYLLLCTRSRACIFALVAFVILAFLGIFRHKFGKNFSIIIALFPLILAVGYLLILDTDWFNEVFSFMVSEGKPLESRERIWKDALSDFSKSPILGNYYTISKSTGVSQMHNTHIDVLCSYGVIPFILFCKVVYDSIRTSFYKNQSYYSYLALCSFCSVIISGSFEAAIVSGSMGLNIMSAAFIWLGHNSEENTDIIEKAK